MQAQTLLVLGDSLSAGYQMPAEQSWPALLNQKWQQQGGKHQLINASISGETTQGALARLPALLKEHQPDWVLIELGGKVVAEHPGREENVVFEVPPELRII